MRRLGKRELHIGGKSELDIIENAVNARAVGERAAQMIEMPEKNNTWCDSRIYLPTPMMVDARWK